MKTATKLFSLVLALALLLTAAASSEGYTLHPILESELEFYTEAELGSIDRLQEQVAAYEAEIDMPELPDVDIYLFDRDGYDTLEAYARAEAAMFGAIPYPFTVNGQPSWGYNSAELYDNEWYIVRNDMFETAEGKIQETCWYSRTEGYAIANSGITVHLPLLYSEGTATPELGIDKCFILDGNLLDTENTVGNPTEIDFIQRELPEALSMDDLVIDYSTRLDSMTELVTVNGRCWYKIAGWVTVEEDNVTNYSVLYLRAQDDQVYGLNFTFPAESNGFDLAVMNTTGF